MRYRSRRVTKPGSEVARGLFQVAGRTPQPEKAAARREIHEELAMSLLGEIVEVGDCEYRGHWHKGFATKV